MQFIYAFEKSETSYLLALLDQIFMIIFLICTGPTKPLYHLVNGAELLAPEMVIYSEGKYCIIP